MTPEKKNAIGQDGVFNVAGQANESKQRTLLNCCDNHIKKIVKELHENGVGLRNTSADTQGLTLLKALQFRGSSGLNTYEGTAAGYARIATRVQELEADGWLIAAPRENVIGPDGLYHQAVARYILIGKSEDFQSSQQELALEVA